MFAQQARAQFTPMNVPPGSPRQAGGGFGGKGGGGRPAVPSGAFAGNPPTMLGAGPMLMPQSASQFARSTQYNPGSAGQQYQPTLGQGSLGQTPSPQSSAQMMMQALSQASPSVAAPTPRPPLPMVQPSLGSQQMPYMPPSIPTPSPQMPIPRPQMPAPGTPTQNPQLPPGLMSQLQNFNFGGF
jgi:hypothetical protein